VHPVLESGDPEWSLLKEKIISFLVGGGNGRCRTPAAHASIYRLQ